MYFLFLTIYILFLVLYKVLQLFPRPAGSWLLSLIFLSSVSFLSLLSFLSESLGHSVLWSHFHKSRPTCFIRTITTDLCFKVYSQYLPEYYSSFVKVGSCCFNSACAAGLTHKARRELHKAARRFVELSSRIFLQSLDGKMFLRCPNSIALADTAQFNIDCRTLYKECIISCWLKEA